MIEGQITTFRANFKKKKGLSFKEDGKNEEQSHRSLEKLLISAAELESQEIVGKGSFGEVHKSKYKGTLVAVKTLRNVDELSLGRFQLEILLMADLHHNNVVRLVGACWETKLMALVMEFCEKGMSSEVCNSEGNHFSWGDPLLKWSMDLARAMKYLHGVEYTDVKTDNFVSGIIHRDLKPDNCLCTETYSIKVADFGEARAFDENNTMTQVGTPLFISPEILKGDRYSTKADVYSYALTLLAWGLRGREKVFIYLYRGVMTKGDKPPSAATMSRPSLGRITHAMVTKGWRPNLKSLKELDIPKSICECMSLCWLDNPDERPNFVEVLDHMEKEATMEIMPAAAFVDPSTSLRSSRRKSVSGVLKARLLAQGVEEEQEIEWGRLVDNGVRNLVDLYDIGEERVNMEELQLGRLVIEGWMKGNEKDYLNGLDGEKLMGRIAEDERKEEGIVEALKKVQERFGERIKKREAAKR